MAYSELVKWFHIAFSPLSEYTYENKNIKEITLTLTQEKDSKDLDPLIVGQSHLKFASLYHKSIAPHFKRLTLLVFSIKFKYYF